MRYLSLFENFGLIPSEIKQNLTPDGKGNLIFYHDSSERRDVIKMGSGTYSLQTSKEERTSLGSVGGLAMYYTRPGDGENLGRFRHEVLVPEDRVYYFNQDRLNFYDEAKAQFKEFLAEMHRHPDTAFTPNYQIAWITKVACEHGFEMVVCQWGRIPLRAQTKLLLKPYRVYDKSRVE